MCIGARAVSGTLSLILEGLQKAPRLNTDAMEADMKKVETIFVHAFGVESLRREVEHMTAAHFEVLRALVEDRAKKEAAKPHG